MMYIYIYKLETQSRTLMSTNPFRKRLYVKKNSNWSFDSKLHAHFTGETTHGSADNSPKMAEFLTSKTTLWFSDGKQEETNSPFNSSEYMSSKEKNNKKDKFDNKKYLDKATRRQENEGAS